MISNKYILPFSKISKKDVKTAGGKGASLGELRKARLPIPPGFVIISYAFDKFLEITDINVEIDSEIDKVNPQDINSVDRASHVIRDLIYDAKIPQEPEEEILEEYDKLKAKGNPAPSPIQPRAHGREVGAGRQKAKEFYVAVRSSATAEDSLVASWAGELETYLNTTRKNLLENVKKCWSSLFTPRAIFYRFEKKLHTSPISVAVIIQKMIESDVSGICFTCHPVTKDKNQMVIEASWGLGELIVSGQITPDTYVVDKKDQRVLDININKQEKMIMRAQGPKANKVISVPKSKQDQQKLNGEQIIELAKLCQKIERHYKLPQDIEWAQEKQKFYILQSRPITTL